MYCDFLKLINVFISLSIVIIYNKCRFKILNINSFTDISLSILFYYLFSLPTIVFVNTIFFCQLTYTVINFFLVLKIFIIKCYLLSKIAPLKIITMHKNEIRSIIMIYDSTVILTVRL